MNGAGFILAINLAVAFLLAASFAAVAVFERDRRAGWWAAASYVTGGAGLSVEFFIANFALGRAGVVIAFGGFLLATLLFNVAVAKRFSVRPPWRSMGLLFMLGLISTGIVYDWPRPSLARMLIYQLPYALMQGIALWIVLSARRSSWADRLFAGLLAASAVHFLCKPALALWAGGSGAAPERYLQTFYAMLSLSLGTVFAFSLALTLLSLLVRDILDEAAGRSETDALSRLLNRGGFERHGAAALADAFRRGLPSALVLIDLDHFKSVNDTFGHAGGDRVIAGFARLLALLADRSMVLARIGGEEFAAVLPGTGLAAARLWAEGARAAFASAPVEGLPEERRFTASFGVAAAKPGEDMAALLQRADAALYKAKAEGRDRVRVSAARHAGRREEEQRGGERVRQNLSPLAGAGLAVRRHRTKPAGED